MAELLTSLGVPAQPSEVITVGPERRPITWRDDCPRARRSWWSGVRGSSKRWTERGLVPVHSADDEPQAVVQGFSPDTDWKMLGEGAVAILGGAFWLATNCGLDGAVRAWTATRKWVSGSGVAARDGGRADGHR